MNVAGTQKGYIFALAEDSSFYIPNALHVERDDTLLLFTDDEEAAKAAERDGVQLIYGMEDVPDGVYLDTPENRAAILDSLEKYPEYRDAAAAEDVPDGVYLDTPENRAAILDSLEKHPEYRNAAAADEQPPDMGIHFTS